VPSNSNYTFIASAEFAVSTTSTSSITVGTIDCGSNVVTKNKIVYVKIRDTSGKRRNYYYGSDSYIVNPNGDSVYNPGVLSYRMQQDGTMRWTSYTGGVYPQSLSATGVITIKANHGSSTNTVDGTFLCEVFLLDWVGDVSPFV
jgi:hypothetical protein